MIRFLAARGKMKPTTLVVVVASLGFGACAVMVGIVTWALSNIRTEREELDTLQSNMVRMVTSLDRYQIQGRNVVMELLNNKTLDRKDTISIKALSRLIASYSNQDVHGAEGMKILLNQLVGQLAHVKKNRDRCIRWNEESRRLASQFPVARKKVRHALDTMRNAILSAEGKVRLERALQIRHYRGQHDKGANNSALNIIEGITRDNDISTAKTELADLALLTERLLAEEDIDHLADLKDNQLRPVIDRLKRVLRSLETSSSQSLGSVLAKLIDFKTALLGHGYVVDTVAQTIIAGNNGLYSLCVQRSRLRQEREALQAEVTNIFHALGDVRQKLVVEMETFASETAAGAEQALGQAWKTMFIVGTVLMAFFLFLSARIVKTLRKQILAIEETNKSLVKEITERERVEQALRQREDELQMAKNDLERRVEERTADLQIANDQLEKEIVVRSRVEKELRGRRDELAEALNAAKKARLTAEAERDRSERMLAEVTEAKRRSEILISDASAREARMIDLKREINEMLRQHGMDPKYNAPARADAFLATGKLPHLVDETPL